MKKLITYIILLSFILNTGFVSYSPQHLRDLSPTEKQEAIQAFINGNCEYKGIKLYGKVKFVDSFEDIRIKYVDSFEDINVQFVSSFPNSCGQWQKVDNFEDIRVKVVDSFEDLDVRIVNSFLGIKN